MIQNYAICLFYDFAHIYKLNNISDALCVEAAKYVSPNIVLRFTPYFTLKRNSAIHRVKTFCVWILRLFATRGNMIQQQQDSHTPVLIKSISHISAAYYSISPRALAFFNIRTKCLYAFLSKHYDILEDLRLQTFSFSRINKTPQGNISSRQKNSQTTHCD